MKLSRSLPLATGALLALAACDQGATYVPPSAPPATVRGALAADAGNQHVSSGLPGATLAASDLRVLTRTVSVATLDDAGALDVIGEGDVGADGRYAITDLPAAKGPLVVQARADDDTVVGAAILPGDLRPGRVSVAVPISRETTVEADALVSLVERGQAPPGRVDGVGLMTRVSAELAAAVYGRDVDHLADAAQAADEVYLRVLGGADGAVDGGAVARARLNAWRALAQALDTAPDEAAEDAAWARFDARIEGDVARATGLGLDRVAAAEAAADVVFAKLAAADLAPDAALHASINAMVRTSVADHALQRAALEGDPRTPGGLVADLDRAYASFEGAVRAAADADAVTAAFAKLSAGISGARAADPASSILGRFTAATAGPELARVVPAQALYAATAAATTLDQALGRAAAASDVVGVTSNAFLGFEKAIQDAVDGRFGASSSGAAGDFVRSVVAQGGGRAGAALHLPALSGVHPDGAHVTGTVFDHLGAQRGADGLSADARFDVLRHATASALMAADASGTLRVVAFGTVDPDRGRIEVDHVTAPVDGAAFLAVLDHREEVLGLSQIAGGVAGTVDVSVPEITAETTVEAKVLLALLDAGHRLEDIDVAYLQDAIDRDVAAAVRDPGDLAALAQGVWLGQTVRDEALAAGGEDADGLAAAWASAAYEATVADLAGTDTRLFAAVDARVQLDNAVALADAATIAFGLGRRETPLGALRVAVDGLVTRTAAATDVAAVRAAGDAFVDDVVGTPRSLVVSLTQGELGLGTRDQRALGAAIATALRDGADFASAVKTAVADAVGQSGRADTVADASVVVRSGEDLRASLQSALSVTALAAIPTDDHAAAGVVVEQVAAGLFGSDGIE